VLRITNLVLTRGAKRLFDAANLTLHAGHKVGLVGANGSGKSSLFAAILGDVLPEAGAIDLPSAWTIAHVAQETPAVAMPALAYVLEGDRELRDVESTLARVENDPAHDGAALADLHHQFDAIGGYSARPRAAALLAGLGFAESRQMDSVASFSGGWRMRLNLAQALLCRSDLLLLDEPTNHLDLDAVLWLEDWLAKYPGTLLLITHDRDFLDGVVDTIVHTSGRALTSYSGNYAQFERERARVLALQESSYAKQRRQIAHLRTFIDRFGAKASKAKQAQSRKRALERMELIAAAHVDSPFEFAFAPADVAARQLVLLERATLGYPERPPVLTNVDFGLLASERIGLLGPNGAGKSTLLKALAGTLPPRAGKRHAAQGLRIGYFAQHQVEQLRDEESPLRHLRRLEPDTREQEHRDFLGGFDFRGDMANSVVGRFSGGERARLTLALIVRQKPNLLLLDEPTNHLDLEMREALTEALLEFQGALVVVAHDRHLLRTTTDILWLVADGAITPFDGDLDDYRDWVLGQRRRERAEAPAPVSAPVDRRAHKRTEAQARQRLAEARRPLATRQAAIERDLDALTIEKTTLQTWLASGGAYADMAKDELKAKLMRQSEVDWQLARLEAEWLEVAEALQRIGA